MRVSWTCAVSENEDSSVPLLSGLHHFVTSETLTYDRYTYKVMFLDANFPCNSTKIRYAFASELDGGLPPYIDKGRHI